MPACAWVRPACRSTSLRKRSGCRTLPTSTGNSAGFASSRQRRTGSISGPTGALLAALPGRNFPFVHPRLSVVAGPDDRIRTARSRFRYVCCCGRWRGEICVSHPSQRARRMGHPSIVVGIEPEKLVHSGCFRSGCKKKMYPGAKARRFLGRFRHD